MSKPLIEIQGLHVALGGQPILQGLNTHIDRGRITALIGLNGSGKTTLLRALLKEVPYRGRIEFRCGHSHESPYPHHIGYVPQRLLFDPNLPLSVLELMALATSWRPLFLGIGGKTRERIGRMLEGVRGRHLLKRPVGHISGGELQRVMLALAMEPEPELLLLDEPAAGIDFQDQGDFYQLIEEINRRTGVTVLLVSHELSMVTRVAHQVLCLSQGRIQCEGPPRDVLTNEMLAQVFGADKSVYAHHAH